jgi:hypothetical protein
MEDSSTGVTTPSLITTVGLVLAPVVGVLIVIELVMVVSQVSYFAHLASYPAHPNGISERRRFWSIAYFCAVWLAPLLVTAFLWFDLIRSRMSKRNRLAMIGLVGGVVAIMSLGLMLAGWDGVSLNN